MTEIYFRLQQSTSIDIQELLMIGIPKIQVRNSVAECALSLRKENAGKFHNYGIQDCIASIAASKSH